MQIQATPFTQHEQKMYNAIMNAVDLVEKSKVDVWHTTNENGYQREPEPTRAKSFSRYVSTEFSPPSIIANIRDTDKDKIRYENGKLEIPDDIPLWLVDGQHRVAGLRILIEAAGEKFANLQLPVVIMVGQSIYEEAKQSVVVNKSQKRVRTDLGERFLQKAVKQEGMENLLNKSYARNIEWIPTAITVVDSLNNDPHSIWHNKIKLPNEPKGATIVSQKAFSDSLKSLLKEDAVYFGRPAPFVSPIINAYWEAVREICPEPFEEPKNYVMQKTTGVVVLHSILPRILKITGKDIPQKNDFVRAIDRIESLKNSSKWSSPDGMYSIMTGQKGSMLIKLELLRELNAVYQVAV